MLFWFYKWVILRWCLHIFTLRGFWCPRHLLYHVNVVCQLKKMEGSHQEATEKEVERILGYLKSYYQDDREFKVDHTDIKFVPLCIYYLITCLCFYHSNIPNILLRVCHRPQLIFPNSRKHFPHVFSHQGELPVLKFVSVDLFCPLVTVSRCDSVVCLSGWAGTDVSRWWQIALYRWEHFVVLFWLGNNKGNVFRWISWPVLCVFVSQRL